MKIITWNINGLRAAINKGALNWIESQNADVVCLQEIKVKPDQLSREQEKILDNYEVIWNSAERPGYSGVITMLREPCQNVNIGMGIKKYDVEGRIIQTRHAEFILMNVYFPNGQRDHSRLSYKLQFYADLWEYCNQLQGEGESIVLCGDFNTAHREIDLKNPKQNEKTSGFLPEERIWIDRFMEQGFIDAYRFLYTDQVQYTWWTYRFGARQRNIGWRLDYFLVSERLMPAVTGVTIHDDVLGSDHCPVTFSLKL